MAENSPSIPPDKPGFSERPGLSGSGRWTVIGGPAGGRVAALAMGHGAAPAVFAGTRVGLFRTLEPGGETAPRWVRLPDVAVEVLSLAVSPAYAEDRTLFAGTARGLYFSRDGGDHWEAARLPMAETMVLALYCSPNYQADGLVLAGTLEDGILYSNTRGESWSYTGVGLLDATFFSLAFSPDFARDGTVFAGAETALYYSYNGGRAWKLLAFPEEAAPVLCLAVSPDFARDGTLCVGTEQSGLYRSTDRGKSWHPLSLSVGCVNALAWGTHQVAAKNQVSRSESGRGDPAPTAVGVLYAATDAGLYASDDRGEHWTCLWDAPDVLSLAGSDELVFAGLADEGAWLAAEGADWRPIFTVPARPLLGMALSPHCDVDPVAFLYGPQEGIWRTVDGGLSWACLDEALPSLDIRSLAISPCFAEDRVLVAASAGGVLLSTDAGDSWSAWSDAPASLVACSPRGQIFAAVYPEGIVHVARTPGGPWASLPGPWEDGGEVLALALDVSLRCRVALLDRAEQTLSLWEGRPGSFKRVLSRPAGASPLAAFWLPADSGEDERWYASLGHEVWELRRAPGESATQSTLAFSAAGDEPVVSLMGARGPQGPVLFACTGEAIFRSGDGKAWTAVQHLSERAVAVTLSPDWQRDASAYALLLGGALWGGVVE
jgi:photosystem II stability/assembly factor-like uncharacterized protein